MKKVFCVAFMVLTVSGVCFAMGGPAPTTPQIQSNGVVTKIVTGELVSWTPMVRPNRVIVTIDVLDANKDITTVDLQLHTTQDWGELRKGMRVEVPFFVSQDGRNVAYLLKELSTAESTASTAESTASPEVK